jgi:hypothetical protein
VIAQYLLGGFEGWEVASPRPSQLMAAARDEPVFYKDTEEQRALRGGRGEFVGGNQIHITTASGRQAINQHYTPYAGPGNTTAAAPDHTATATTANAETLPAGWEAVISSAGETYPLALHLPVCTSI